MVLNTFKSEIFLLKPTGNPGMSAHLARVAEVSDRSYLKVLTSK